LGQIVGYLRDHGYSYTPALVISGSMHMAAFLLICVLIPKIQPLALFPGNRELAKKMDDGQPPRVVKPALR